MLTAKALTPKALEFPHWKYPKQKFWKEFDAEIAQTKK
jgi:hypothetical protein